MPSTPNTTTADCQRAADILLAAIQAGEQPRTSDGRDFLSVAFARRGGLKGGAARAAKLSHARRKQIARNAARARWREVKK
jgi:hypothetical protein